MSDWKEVDTVIDVRILAEEFACNQRPKYSKNEWIVAYHAFIIGYAKAAKMIE